MKQIKTHALLMELIMSCAIFALSSVVIAGVFVKAYALEKNFRYMDDAVRIAQDTIEIYRFTDDEGKKSQRMTVEDYEVVTHAQKNEVLSDATSIQVEVYLEDELIYELRTIRGGCDE